MIQTGYTLKVELHQGLSLVIPEGGESYHNWGLAFDAAPFENGVKSNDVKKFKTMGRLGEQVGLEWGGGFKDLIDYPHFQYTFGLSTEDLLNGVTPST